MISLPWFFKIEDQWFKAGRSCTFHQPVSFIERLIGIPAAYGHLSLYFTGSEPKCQWNLFLRHELWLSDYLHSYSACKRIFEWRNRHPCWFQWSGPIGKSRWTSIGRWRSENEIQYQCIGTNRPDSLGKFFDRTCKSLPAADIQYDRIEILPAGHQPLAFQ